MPHLITGATGAIGRHVVHELLAAGESVRALTRHPETAALPAEVEVVAGDLADVTSLPDAVFESVQSVFVFPAEAGVERFAAQAAAAGARRFVLLSSLAAACDYEHEYGSANAVHHLAAEAAVAATGVPTTVLRPGAFAKNLLAWVQPIRYTGRVQGPYPQAAQALIHETDIAAVAALALLQEGHEGKTYAMTGPQALTRVQQLDAIGAAIGRDLVFEEISPDAFAEQMSAHLPTEISTMLLNYWKDAVHAPDVVRPSVEQLTGRPARTLAQWACDHAADFGGSCDAAQRAPVPSEQHR